MTPKHIRELADRVEARPRKWAAYLLVIIGDDRIQDDDARTILADILNEVSALSREAFIEALQEHGVYVA